MTTVAAMLRDGILDGNWKHVCVAYEAMTGEHLEPPAPPVPPKSPAEVAGEMVIPDHLLDRVEHIVQEEFVGEEPVEFLDDLDPDNLEEEDPFKEGERLAEEMLDEVLQDLEEETTNKIRLQGVAEGRPFQYVCEYCGQEDHFKKARVRCSGCNKHTLKRLPKPKKLSKKKTKKAVVSDVKPPTRTGSAKYEDFIAPSRNPDSVAAQGRRQNEDGEMEALKVPFNADRSELAGKEGIGDLLVDAEWDDDRTLEMDDSIKANPEKALKLGTVRTSKTFKRAKDKQTGQKIAVKCSLCARNFRVIAGYARGFHKNEEFNRWKCNGCLTSGSRRRGDTHGSTA